jgi:hypothetical protein
MSSTGGAEPGSAEDQAYFRAIEDRFLALRGSATLLSAEDWQTARGWRRLGVPLELVLRTLEELFARQRERRPKRGISSLRYFRAAVEAAFEEQLELAAGGSRLVADPGPPLSERLARLAAAIPGGVPGGAAVAAEVAGLDGLDGGVEAVELRLARIEARWLDELEAGLDADHRAELVGRVDRALGAARIALPADELAAARARLLRQALRERHGLPLLSLFAPVALANGSEPPGP